MRIAIFADIHGKILLPFKLVELYQKETGNKIDFILQCGDMGAFPFIEKLDKATIRHAARDRDELGFHDQFSKVDSKIKSFLDRLDVVMICVRGNHEDHDFLDEKELLTKDPYYSIDVYNKVYVCKSGFEQEFIKNNEVLKFVGIGRIGDIKKRKDKKFIQDFEKNQISKLVKTKNNFDILISHDKADVSQRGHGMDELRTILDNVIIDYHFYGHTGEPFCIEMDTNGITQSVKIKELEFNDSGILPYGCMVIFTKNIDNTITLDVVSQKVTNNVTKFNWKFI